MRFDTWLTLSGSEMDLEAISDLETPNADFGGRLRPPVAFASYSDPQGRFLLRYPDCWSLLGGPPIAVRSLRLPLTARVDLLAGPEVTWERVRDTVTGTGGILIGERRLPGASRQLRGHVVATDGLVEVHALAVPLGTTVVVLSTFRGPTPTPRLEHYGRDLLAAVRREFRVPLPAPPG
jgi:hypothetical protein